MSEDLRLRVQVENRPGPIGGGNVVVSVQGVDGAPVPVMLFGVGPVDPFGLDAAGVLALLDRPQTSRWAGVPAQVASRNRMYQWITVHALAVDRAFAADELDEVAWRISELEERRAGLRALLAERPAVLDAYPAGVV
ncbi:hypothetical protein [Parafrankia discariae]|uniref:hypothetical protein n=1 Tax=Parafrankia discariae TaxID=365528 RepID=UPI0003820401|nr:hypothetical protein [Parafrankia discariae]